MKKFDLHERLIDFAVQIIAITDNLKISKQEIIYQDKLFDRELHRY